MNAKGLLLSATSALVFAGTYFFLLDGVRISMEQRHLVIVWWVLLAAFLGLLFAFALGSEILKRPRSCGFGYLLLAGALYCYDPTINPFLAAHGFGRLWLVLLLAFFIWLGALGGWRRDKSAPQR